MKGNIKPKSNELKKAYNEVTSVLVKNIKKMDGMLSECEEDLNVFESDEQHENTKEMQRKLKKLKKEMHEVLKLYSNKNK